ncbi:hypothetical protein Val02_53220 [Virgisporangium aliadipatigenens]|uniref:Uncharacterized protein n=2 Tax=Virgisporangium aliadipatigenens TaxID=741659 RepID=A0A8J3YNF0_9ACTN|nr:hypothetical protein Val02_53220 [Virgisporangium aliadipatigenens]
MKDLERLSALDPARDRQPTAHELARAAANLDRIIAGPARVPRRVTGRWLAVGAAAVATGVAAAVIVPALLPNTADRATAGWTSAPSARTGDQVLPQARACGRQDVGGSTSTVRPEDVLLAEQRGIATLLILRKNGMIVECLSADGAAMASMSLREEGTIPPVPAGQVTLETMSSWGPGRGDDLWSNIVGLVAADVTAVELRLDSGRVIQASVRGGWWGAWWPGPEGGEIDHFVVIVHTAAGVTEHRPSTLE